ncbi:MAG: dephospho-CoA kinase [Chlamydiota bacterium]
MLKLKKLAITGGIASGKTTLAHYFKELGAYLVETDEVAHQLLSLNTSSSQDILKLLGPEIIAGNYLDRRRIADKVFKNASLLKALEKILHPRIRAEIEKQYNTVKKQQRYPLFVVEVPLLFEVSEESFYDYVITVITEERKCIKRFKQTTGYDEKEYYQRMNNQLTPSTKAARSDFIVNNNSSLKALRREAQNIFNKLLEEKN